MSITIRQFKRSKDTHTFTPPIYSDSKHKNNKYGFRFDESNPLFYNFVRRNKQWILFSDNKRISDILFANYFKWITKSKVKHFIHNDKIITKIKLVNLIKSVDTKCVGCNTNILVNANTKIHKRNLLCSECKIQNIDQVKLIHKLNEIIKINTHNKEQKLTEYINWINKNE